MADLRSWKQTTDHQGETAQHRLDAVACILANDATEADANSGGAAYLFRFDWAPAGDKARFGAAHGFDEPFVWNLKPRDSLPLMAGSPDKSVVARQMSDALVAFARSGDTQLAPSVFSRRIIRAIAHVDAKGVSSEVCFVLVRHLWTRRRDGKVVRKHRAECALTKS